MKINQNLIGVYGIINDIEPSYEEYGKEKQTMNNEKVYGMSFAKIYPLLVAKAEKKGRTVEEVNEIICWLTGYENQEIENALSQQKVDSRYSLRSACGNHGRVIDARNPISGQAD